MSSYKKELLDKLSYEMFNIERNIKQCEESFRLATTSIVDYKKQLDKLKLRQEFINSIEKDCE